MDTSKVFQKELNSYREQLAKPYFVDENVNEALLEEAYDRMLKDIGPVISLLWWMKMPVPKIPCCLQQDNGSKE